MKVQKTIFFSIAMFFVFTVAAFAQQVKTDYDQWDPLESTCRHASLSIL